MAPRISDNLRTLRMDKVKCKAAEVGGGRRQQVTGGRTSGQSALPEIYNGDARSMSPDLHNCHIEVRVFWYVTPCASMCRRFGGTSCLHLEGDHNNFKSHVCPIMDVMAAVSK